MKTPPQSEFTEAEVVALVWSLRNRSGGVRPLAQELGVTQGYVRDVLHGRRAPGPPFLNKLGIRKEVVTRYVAVS